MLGKILLTLFVIILAALYVRKRSRKERAVGRKSASENAAPLKNPWQSSRQAGHSSDIPETRSGTLPDYRIAAWLALCVLLALGATLYYSSWQDARSSVTVILHRGDAEAPVIYEVRKRDLGDRSFTTVDGTRVTVSASERMEIIGL